ncbi:MAG: DUF4325 domain-containing protein [bacterium]
MEEIKNKVLNFINKKKRVGIKSLVDKFGFSRAYLNRVLNSLIKDKKIIRIGQTNQVRYLPFEEEILLQNKLFYKKKLKNKELYEDLVFREVVRETNIFICLEKNVFNILEYAFLEMLNNAIDHSESEFVEVSLIRETKHIEFTVVDKGVGIFSNIMRKKALNDQYEAIQDLLKGKQTTAPEFHSGEGIFFTSKLADFFSIRSGDKELVFENQIKDIFVSSKHRLTGTKICFKIVADSQREMVSIFDKFTTDYEFDATEIKVKMYQIDNNFVSRSQARRLLVGLEGFTRIVLDFHQVVNVGQSFADEIFRVYQKHHPDKQIQYINADSNAEFMIKRALNTEL